MDINQPILLGSIGEKEKTTPLSMKKVDYC